MAGQRIQVSSTSEPLLCYIIFNGNDCAKIILFWKGVQGYVKNYFIYCYDKSSYNHGKIKHYIYDCEIVQQIKQIFFIHPKIRSPTT